MSVLRSSFSEMGTFYRLFLVLSLLFLAALVIVWSWEDAQDHANIARYLVSLTATVVSP